MTHDEIRAAIAADPALLALARAVPTDTFAIAAALSVGRTVPAPYEAGDGAFLETMPLDVANALLDALKAAPSYRHAKSLLERGALRLDKPSVQAGLQSLVGATLAAGVVLEQAHIDALFAIATKPDPVDEFAVRCALFSGDGALRV